ncbi:MAG: pentapeptide repeat-containing protein [Cenarchaeum sp. SB0677_bin_16]|nr:pentapeptide repeat-containing protein [Cenarchaeum sp. SB0677_bin_16]
MARPGGNHGGINEARYVYSSIFGGRVRRCNGHCCRLHGCRGFGGADLFGANLTGADLSYADMRGADLQYAVLSTETNFKTCLAQTWHLPTCAAPT